MTAAPPRPPAAPEIYIDADACPVRDDALRVAARHGLRSHVVCNGGIRPPASPLARLVVVDAGADAADDWIEARIGAFDIVVTNDIPLAARAVAKGALAIRPDGRVLDEDAIGMARAMRDLMSGLRETGVVTGGPAGFGKRQRSRFLDAFETLIRRAGRERAKRGAL